MCGICGSFDPAGVQPAQLAAMMQTLVHRGPDDEGCYVNGRIGLGHRRLSIIDLAGGRQPLSNEDESVWVVLNGEVYNYKSLRRELQQAGHLFRTQSDSEVIVHLYEELGERCLERLRGMFALALWDGRQQKLLLARDHLGQKPLYYAQQGDAFLFASEIKGILAVSPRPPEVDLESLHYYLSLRFLPPPRTMFCHIHKLPAAHGLVFQNGQTTIWPYWRLSFREKLQLPEDDLIEMLREKLAEVVSLHLVSDVPVGAFLSGGLDSSMVVAFMAQALDTPVSTFAVGAGEPSFDELPFARLVAERYRTAHLETGVRPDLLQSLPEMIWHLDEPSDPIAACQYQAAALAARQVKVVLGGDGGDELFAGFDRYLGLGYVNHYARLPRFLRQQFVGRLLAWLPENFAYKSVSQRLRWLQQLSDLPTPGERYAEATCFFRFNQAQKMALYGEELRRRLGHLNSADEIVRHYDQAPAADPLDRMLYADYQTRLPEHSLLLADRMTMAHSLELRSPYLDHELVTFMAAVPSQYKIRGRRLKYLLRKLGQEYLPPEIAGRGKHGFMFPVAHWFQGQLFPFIRDYLLASPFVDHGLFRREAVVQLVDDHRAGRIDNHVRLWMLLNLALWHRLYLEQWPLDSVREELHAYWSRR